MTKPWAVPRRLGSVHPPLRVLPFAFIALVMAAACSVAPGASMPPSAPPSSPAAANEGPIASLSVVPAANPPDYSGILSIDAIEGGCAYLQADDGRKLQVIYPNGWQLKKSPLELIAPDGSVHSKGGDRVSVNGSEAHDIATICQIGPVIQASGVLPP